MDTDTTGDGPIDVVMLSFPGNQFNGAIAPALRDLVVRGLVRVVDLASAPTSSPLSSTSTGSWAAGCSTPTTSRTSRPAWSPAARWR